jgi:hypothetical protein
MGAVVSIVLAVALLFAVWSGPPTLSLKSDKGTSLWPLAGLWFAWAMAIAAICFAILVMERGWPS